MSNHIELGLNSWSETEKVTSGRKNKTLKIGKQGASGSSRKKVSSTLFSLLPLNIQERQNETKPQAKRSSKYSDIVWYQPDTHMHRLTHRQTDLQFHTHRPWVLHYACSFPFLQHQSFYLAVSVHYNKFAKIYHYSQTQDLTEN